MSRSGTQEPSGPGAYHAHWDQEGPAGWSPTDWAPPYDEPYIELLPRLLLYGWSVILAMAVVPFAGEVVLLVAALHALRGTRQSVETLLVLALAIIINKDLAPVDISLLRWVVLAAAAGRVAWDGLVNGQPVPRAFWWLTLFFATLVLFAFMASWLPTVSLFKAISFYLGAGTAMVALYRTRHLVDYWQSVLLTISAFVILGSIPLYFSLYGFMRNGISFQGILNHPQTYGPISAVFTAFVTGLVMYERQRSWVLVLTMLAGWVGVYFSQSRTGMLALVLAGGGVIVAGWFKSHTWLPRIRQALNGIVIVLGLLGLGVLGTLYGPALSEGLVGFLMKDESAEDITSALEDSRGDLIARSMDNFYEAPLTGIGLGVPSDLAAADIEYGPMNIPIGATVEKGFTPAAVLEETGLIGTILFVIVLLALLLPVLRWGPIAVAWMAGTALLTNLGEAFIFSIGGNGLFIWLMFSLAYVCSVADRDLPPDDPAWYP